MCDVPYMNDSKDEKPVFNMKKVWEQIISGIILGIILSIAGYLIVIPVLEERINGFIHHHESLHTEVNRRMERIEQSMDTIVDHIIYGEE